MLSSYQVVLWKQESFGVLRPLQNEFFRSLLGLTDLLRRWSCPRIAPGSQPRPKQDVRHCGCVLRRRPEEKFGIQLRNPTFPLLLGRTLVATWHDHPGHALHWLIPIRNALIRIEAIYAIPFFG